MIFLVDMSSMIHAYFHVQKDDDAGDVTERCLNRLKKLRLQIGSMKHFEDAKWVAVFDNPNRESFRHLILPRYKSSRTTHEGLAEIEQATRIAVDNDADWIGITAPALMESDDVIASIAAQYHGRVVIHSDDRDFHQCLVDGRVTILKKSTTPAPGEAMDLQWFSAKSLQDKYGLPPDQWVDFQTLVGGKDDVPGWPGVGEKAAKKLIDAGWPNGAPYKLNKIQQESFAHFTFHCATWRRLQTLRTDLDWPAHLMAEG